MWWVYFLLGIVTGAYLFQNRVRHAVNKIVVWIFQKIQGLLDKTNEDSDDE